MSQTPKADHANETKPDEAKAHKEVARAHGPRRFMRTAVEHTEDTFKLLVAPMKKNFSYVWREPKLVDLDHCHIFHSINDTTLQPNKYCSPVGGHFHECTPYVDKGGNMRVKVGPPLHFVARKVSGNRTIRRAVPLTFERKPLDNEYDQEMEGHPGFMVMKDEHTHEDSYLGSQVFTANSKANQRQEEQAKIKGVTAGEPVSTQPTAQTRLTTGPEKEHVKGVLKEATTPRKDGTDGGAS